MSSRRIGSYQITDYVGSGGFGSVFKAEDVNTPGRIVAIKELHKKHTRNQVIKQRFFQEAVAMARLDHPNLPRLYTFGEDNGSYYLVMEFISGKLLSDHIHETGPLRPDRAVTVLTQVLDAVSYAHRNGIIHRDLKPDNIMLVGGAGSNTIKVLDFGIARMVGGESLTLAGEGFGTPSYMAPERMSGAAGDDPRMDLYAAGIILYELLTGNAPFESKKSDPAEYWIEMRELHLREPLPALESLGVAGKIEQIAIRATAKHLEHRYQSADEMLNELRGLGQSSASDAPTVVLAKSRLLVSTTPSAAEVYVDDVRRGTSDAERGRLLIDGLAAGLHTVRVLKEGFNEYRISVSLEEGRQTDLQVAIPARATVAMPPSESTAPGGLETLKFQEPDEAKTALLTVESLPAGTALFIGSRPVGSAGEDGRAILKLSPGEYEIRAATPKGEVGTRRVTVPAQSTASGMTMTVPLSQATMPGGASRTAPSARGKQLAAAAVVILLLALAAAAYFVLRGPGRTQESASNATAAGVSPSEPAPSPAAQSDSQANEENRKAAEPKRQTEQEAQKKAGETAGKAETKEPSKPITSVTTNPPAPPTPAETVPPPAVAAKDGCVLVTVQDPDGQPVQGTRVGLEDSGGGRFAGRTGPNGHWRQCGLAIGSTVRVAAFGALGMINPQSAVVMQRTFITIRLPKRLDDAPQRMPDRPRPFRRRP